MLEFKFTQSRTFQVWINRLYGWGAALVLLGALFKLEHWAGASYMLVLGMSTECFIFFISAFEPLEKKHAWEKVFPELHGEEIEEPVVSRKAGLSSNIPANVNLGIDDVQADKLRGGIERLGHTIDQLTGLAAVAEASSRLTENLDRANNAVSAVGGSADRLTHSYITTAETISVINDQAKKGLENMTASQVGYNQQMDFLSKNLAAVNASFELQLQENERYKQSYDVFNKEVSALVGSVKKSVEQTQELTSTMATLNTNVGQLNNVYGSMLTAVTSVLNR